MSDHIVLGNTNAWGKDQRPFILSERDRRMGLLAMGMPGVGKSTLLFNLIMQDIRAGRGLALLDPHGDISADVMACIPKRRIRDVVYFDPSDTEYPVAFNPLAKTSAQNRHLVVSGIVAVFKASWGEFFGPRMENILRYALAALLECENVSLLSLQRMLSDDRYRAWVVKQVDDPLVRAFWEREFESIDRRTRAEYVAPILNKVGALLLSPQMRNILGQVRNRVDARSMMDNRKIFIANLSKGKIGDGNSNLLGSLWVTQFQLAAMSRAGIPEEQRTDFYLYVDEWHSFVSESFVSALAECRKYRLSLILANQYLGQLKESIREAVLGTVGSFLAFRVGHGDAESLEKAFGKTYASSAFTTLSNGEVYAKITTHGQAVEPFFGRTAPPQKRQHDWTGSIMQNSRQRYATQRDVIERRIKKWLRT